MPSARPESHDPDDARPSSRTQRTVLTAVAIVAIAALLAGGAWMTVRFARDMTAAGEQQRSTLERDLARSVSEGQEQARLESELQASIVDDEPLPPPEDDVDDRDREAWSTFANTFVVRELITPVAIAETQGNDNFDVIAVLHKATRTLDTSTGVHPAAEAGIRIMLATSYFQHQQIDDAASQAEQALDILRLNFGEAHRYTRRAMQNLGIVRLHQRRTGEAIELMDRLVTIRMSVLGDSHVATQRSVALVSLIRGHAAEIDGGPSDVTAPLPSDLENWFNLNYECCTFRPLEY